jgi:hypothetical protein
MGCDRYMGTRMEELQHRAFCKAPVLHSATEAYSELTSYLHINYALAFKYPKVAL